MTYQESLKLLGVKASESLDSITKAYKKLLIESHPDHGGTSEKFQAVRKAYKVVLENYKYDKHTKDENTNEWSSERVSIDPELQSKLVELFENINTEHIDIEILGNWIWITGNTYPIKSDIKKCEFKFSKNKTAWYWHPEGYKKRSKKTFDLSEIAKMHGRMEVNSNRPKMLVGAK